MEPVAGSTIPCQGAFRPLPRRSKSSQSIEAKRQDLPEHCLSFGICKVSTILLINLRKRRRNDRHSVMCLNASIKYNIITMNHPGEKDGNGFAILPHSPV